MSTLNPFQPGSHFHEQVAEQLAQPVSKPRRKIASLMPILAEPTCDGTTLTLTMPLPHRVLHKNGRTKNHKWRASLAATAKNIAYFATLTVRPKEQWNAVRVDAEFWTQNRLDDDGAWGWVAPYRDGIAVALKLNDKHFTCGEIIQHNGKASEGKRQVRITIRRTA